MSKKLETWETISEDPNLRWCCAKTGFDAAWGATPEQARENWEHQQMFFAHKTPFNYDGSQLRRE